jgi:hypothetical protein
MSINPGFTGAREDFNMTAMFRRKWFNIPNSPYQPDLRRGRNFC